MDPQLEIDFDPMAPDWDAIERQLRDLDMDRMINEHLFPPVEKLPFPLIIRNHNTKDKA